MSQLGVTRAGDSHALIHGNACIRGRLKTTGQTLLFFKSCMYHIFCWQLKKRHALSLTNAPYSCRPCEERGWHCNISDLAPYYPACFTDASLALLPYNMISKIVRHIFVKLFHGMCQSLEAISWVFSAFHFLFPTCSVIAMVCQHFPIAVCGINLSQQTVSYLPFYNKPCISHIFTSDVYLLL